MKKIYLSIVCLLGLHLFLLVNLQFTAWPEMVSFPYFFNNGFKLYGDMIHAYPPLLTFALSFIYKIFGYNLISLKVFTWIGILACDILIFLIVKQITKSHLFSFLSLFFYIATQPFLDGNMLWFDTALTLPVLLAIYYRKNLVLAGLFLSIALFVKQTAVFFILAFLLFFRKTKILLPIICTGIVFLTWLVLTNQLESFWAWNLYYPMTFWTKYPSYEIISLTKRELFNIVLIAFPAIAIFLFYFKKITKDKDLLLLFLLLLAGIVAVYPRFSFYHFQPALALTAIFLGGVLRYVKKIIWVFPIYLLALIYFIAWPKIKADWGRETRFWSNYEFQTANKINAMVLQSDQIYLLGPHSLIYVMSNKLTPKPWVDNYGWYFEIPGIQEKVLESWKKNPPKIIVIQDPESGQWYEIGTYQPQIIMNFINKNYNKEVEIASGAWVWRRK